MGVRGCMGLQGLQRGARELHLEIQSPRDGDGDGGHVELRRCGLGHGGDEDGAVVAGRCRNGDY